MFLNEVFFRCLFRKNQLLFLIILAAFFQYRIQNHEKNHFDQNWSLLKVFIKDTTCGRSILSEDLPLLVVNSNSLKRANALI